MPSNWKTQQWPQDRKKSVFIPVPKKGNAKECSKERRGESNCGAEVINAISYLCFWKKLDVVKILSANIVYYGRIWDTLMGSHVKMYCVFSKRQSKGGNSGGISGLNEIGHVDWVFIVAREKFQNLSWRVARLKILAGTKRQNVCKCYQLA